MPYAFPPALQALVGEQMASGKYASEDELLQSALHALAEEEQDLDPCANLWQSGVLAIPVFPSKMRRRLRGKHGPGKPT